MVNPAPAAPSGRLITPDLRRASPMFVRGEGVELVAADGERYLDAASGVGVACLGYGVTEIVDAMEEQARRLPYLHALRFESEPSHELARLISARTPGDLDCVFFASGGSEANESAFKFARQYWLEVGEPERWRIIGRWPSFHGNTLATLSAGWHHARRKRHAPMLLPFPHVEAPNTYRGCGLCRGSDRCTLACAEQLERTIIESGPETVSAFIAEPVIGAAAGGLVPPPDYFPAVRDICDRYGVLLIADEVITGFGRLGRWFGIERFDVVPDILVFAKGVAAGYAPLGGFAVSNTLLEPMRRGTGRFEHNFTYAGHPIGTAVGAAVVNMLARDDVIERVATIEHRFFAALHDALADIPIVGDIRGMGLLAGVELVSDPATKQTFDQAALVAERAARCGLDERVIIYPCSGGVDGGGGDYLLVMPPLVTEEKDLVEMARRLACALTTLAAELSADRRGRDEVGGDR
jgi:adenosylmethionine-8-amino-7-oxononanoate aminotransferase